MLFFTVIAINSFLKFCVLSRSASFKYAGALPWIILIFSTILEHLVFLGSISPCLLRQYKINENFNIDLTNLISKLYTAFTLPEIGKIIAVILQTWDSSPIVLFTINILIISIQYSSARSIIVLFDSSKNKFFTWFVCAVLIRLILRLSFYSVHNVVAMGIVA